MVTDSKIQILLPNFKGLLPPVVEREITTSITRIVDYFNNKLHTQQDEFDTKLKETTDHFNKILEDPTGLVNLFATPVIGSSTTDPLLQNLIQNFGSQLQNLIFASPSGVSGNASFRALVALDIPNLDTGKLTTGTLLLARLDTKILKTDDSLNKIVAAAPYVNDGYITISDNNGHSIRIMTTA